MPRQIGNLLPPSAFLAHAPLEARRAPDAGYKRPRFVEFVEKIPRDYNGKPLGLTMNGRPVTAD